jgi:hypothetical protein
MDPRDRLPPFVNGVECAVCGRTVPRASIRVLASRDDLTFVELTCEACRSDSLGIVVATDAWPDEVAESAAGHGYGEFLPADSDRFREALPIAADDVLRFRDALAAGGFAGLIGADTAPDDEASR